MDIENLRDIADYQFDRQVQLQSLKEVFNSKLLVAHNGGLFLANPTLIAFLQAFGKDNQIVIEDTYGNPVKARVGKLLELAIQTYQLASTEWYESVESVNAVRRALDV